MAGVTLDSLLVVSQEAVRTKGGRDRAGDPGLLRKLNVSAALQAFFAAETLTVSELQRTIGVSRPTAEDVLSGLLAQRHVEEAEVAASHRSAGRPARRYRFAARERYAVGIDVGAHSVGCVVTDLRGQVRGSKRKSIRPTATAPTRLREAARLVAATLEALDIPTEHVVGTGCGITGVVLDGGRPIDVRALPSGPGLHTYSLPGFADIDIPSTCAEIFGADVLVANDIKLAALAEHGHGVAAGIDDLVFMHAGRRLGSSIIVGGQVMLGRHGLAGEIGAMRLLGWAEAMERFEAVRSRARAKGSRSDGTGELFAAAAAGDPTARNAVEAVALALALGASALVHAVDPSLVVLGGGLSRLGDAIAEPFRRHLEETSFIAPPVALSRLGEESVGLGAARLALTTFQDRLVAV